MQKLVLKACPCVVVDGKILAFEHPTGGFQIPKGTVEPEEPIELAVLRELEEESGISTGRIIDKVGEMDWFIEPGIATFTAGEFQRWHLYLVDPGTVLPNRWKHNAEGSEAEAGLVFHYFWQPLDHIPDGFHPIFRKVMSMVTNFI